MNSIELLQQQDSYEALKKLLTSSDDEIHELLDRFNRLQYSLEIAVLGTVFNPIPRKEFEKRVIREFCNLMEEEDVAS